MLILLSHPLIYRANAELQTVEALAPHQVIVLAYFQELFIASWCWFHGFSILCSIHFTGWWPHWHFQRNLMNDSAMHERINAKAGLRRVGEGEFGMLLLDSRSFPLH